MSHQYTTDNKSLSWCCTRNPSTLINFSPHSSSSNSALFIQNCFSSASKPLSSWAAFLSWSALPDHDPSITIVGWSHPIQQWQPSVQELQPRLLYYHCAQSMITVILQSTLSQMRISSSSPNADKLAAFIIAANPGAKPPVSIRRPTSQSFCSSGE